MTKHVTMIAGDEGDNAYLWSLQESDARFICMSWELTPEKAEELKGAPGRIKMEVPPNQQAECADEQSAYRFFAGPIDDVLSSCAEFFLQKLKNAPMS